MLRGGAAITSADAEAAHLQLLVLRLAGTMAYGVLMGVCRMHVTNRDDLASSCHCPELGMRQQS